VSNNSTVLVSKKRAHDAGTTVTIFTLQPPPANNSYIVTRAEMMKFFSLLGMLKPLSRYIGLFRSKSCIARTIFAYTDYRLYIRHLSQILGLQVKVKPLQIATC